MTYGLKTSLTCFNRPSVLAEGGRSAAFTYNADGDRVKMAVTDSTGTIPTRYYLGGRYECDSTAVGITERLYLGGDAYSAPMVLQKVNSGNWTAYNIGRDYLGSVTHIATASGTLVAEYSYDPWGRLRDPETLEIYYPGDEPELFLGRGFTGHEHLGWFGLINMNARLYDPLLGRFLSPDPYVQAPDFTQNLNRYSYALNNPLKYTDKSGEFIIIDSYIVGLLAGGEEIGEQMALNDLRIWGGLFNLDRNEGYVGEFISRFTWQLTQTVIGFIVAHSMNTFRIAGGIGSVEYLHGATVLQSNDDWGAFTLGSYIMGDKDIKAEDSNALFQHEFGHYLQSQDHGLLWFFTYGIESAVSALNNDYYRHNTFYTEHDANARALQYFVKHYGTNYAEEKWNYEDNPIKDYDNTKSLSENMPTIESAIIPLLFSITKKDRNGCEICSPEIIPPSIPVTESIVL